MEQIQFSPTMLELHLTPNCPTPAVVLCQSHLCLSNLKLLNMCRVNSHQQEQTEITDAMKDCIFPCVTFITSFLYNIKLGFMSSLDSTNSGLGPKCGSRHKCYYLFTISTKQIDICQFDLLKKAAWKMDAGK